MSLTNHGNQVPSPQKLDIHKQTAARMFNVSYEDVTPEQRAKAKTQNFYKVYGSQLKPALRYLKDA